MTADSIASCYTLLMRLALFPTLLLGAGLLHAQAPSVNVAKASTSLVVQRLIEDSKRIRLSRSSERRSGLPPNTCSGVRVDCECNALADKLTADIRRVGHDQHLTVVYSFMSPEAEEPADPHLRDTMHRIEEASGLGVRGVFRLPGNVGLLDLAYFSEDPESASVLEGAMLMLHGTDAVIIDLRRNMGGNPIMVDRLLTYFFSKQMQLTSIRWRDGGREHTDEQWTLSFVPGERMADVPLFVLTSAHTFSAAEQCAYDLQVLHRATLVGETTGGGANPAAATHALGAHFDAFIPNGEAMNPVTHTNWEAVGVRPDVRVSASGSLLEAYTRALKAGKPSVSAPHLERNRQKALADPASALREVGFLASTITQTKN